MPFISVQSIYKKVVAIISTITERIATNFLYDLNSSTGVGRPVISEDGTWMMTSGGGSNAGSTSWTGIRVYKRTGGPGSDWTYIQEILPPGWTEMDKYLYGVWGSDNATMSKDGSRITVLADQLYVFSRSGDVWSLEDTVPTYEAQYMIKFKTATFNTGTGVNGTKDEITTDNVNEFVWGNAYTVVYDKEGGSAAIGLTEYEPTGQLYYFSPYRKNFSSSSVNSGTGVITTSTHDFVTGDPVRYRVFNNAQAKIDLLTPDTVLYYVRSLGSTTLALYPTATDATNDTNRIQLDVTVRITASTVTAGGTGYSVNDLLTVTGGTLATGGLPTMLRVTSVSSGVITGITVLREGSYIVAPAAPMSVTGGTGSSATFGRTTSNTNTHYIQHAKRISLYTNATDADNQTNKVQLISTGSETHTLSITSDYSSDWGAWCNFTIAINDNGSRICSQSATIRGSEATIVVWDRSGTSWTESARIPVRCANALDLDTTYWRPGDNAYEITKAVAGLDISGDGNTITVGVRPGFNEPSSRPSAYSGGYFIYTASNPSYGNKPTIQLVDDTFSYQMKPGATFQLQTYPTPHASDGKYVIDTVESPTLITIDVAKSQGTLVDHTTNIYVNATYMYFDSAYQHVYHYNGATWDLQAALISPETHDQEEQFAEFGAALSYNGNVLATADPYGPNANYDTGRVYVFERTGSTWSYTETLASGNNWAQRLGSSLAMSNDGNTIVAGAPWYGPYIYSTDSAGYLANPEGYVNLWPRPPYGQNSQDQAYGGGKVYVFKRPSAGNPYTLQDSYFPFTNNYGSTYTGDSVDMSGDGKIVVASSTGSISYEAYGIGDRCGTVAVWEELTYTPAATVTRNYAEYTTPPVGYIPTSNTGAYGTKHKISSDGSTLAVCYEDSINVDIYTSSYAGTNLVWSLQTTLFPSIAAVTTIKSIDISATGNKIVLSCDTATTEAIVTFVNTGTWTEYSQNAETTPRVLTYGSTICISGDGNTLCIEGDTLAYEEEFDTSTGVNTSTDIITLSNTTNNSFVTGELVWYDSRSTGINIGLNPVNTIYWVRRVSNTQISIHTSYGGAINNTGKVNLTAGASSVQAIRRAIETKYAFPFTWNSGTNKWDLLGYNWIGETKSLTRNFARSMALSNDGTVFFGSAEYQSIAYQSLDPNNTGDRYARSFAYKKYASPVFTPQWVTVTNGGTGYTLNDILTVTSGTPTGSAMTIQVTAESGGVIQSAVVLAANTYSEISDSLSGVTVTGGTGSNASLKVWWDGARYILDPNATITITAAGTGYSATLSTVSILGGTQETKPTILDVTSVNGTGGITGISVLHNEVYTSIPDPNTPTSIYTDVGSSATVNLQWLLAESQHKNGWIWLRQTSEVGIYNWLPDGLTLLPKISISPASMSADGSVAVVGYENTNFIYINERNNYTQQAIHQTAVLYSDTPNVDTGLASSLRGLAVSGDGSTIVAGAWKKTVTGNTNAGALFVFRKANQQWRQEQYIPLPCVAVDANFGLCVSISSDGSIITASAPGQSTVYSFTVANPGAAPGCPVPLTPVDTYTLNTIMNPTEMVANQYFGESVTMDSTGTRIIVSGAETKVFKKSVFSNQWEFEQELIPASNPTLSARITGAYGAGVAISADGTLAVVTAPTTTNGANTNVGEAYVFSRTGSVWTHDDTIYPTTIADDIYFGQAVVINTAKNVIAISSNSGFGTGPGTGEAYIYRDISGTWTGVAISPTVASTFSGSIDYVDNGTNKGLLVFGGQDAGNQARIYICEHIYGTPDTLTITSTHTAPVAATGFGVYKHSVKFSADKGQYIVVSDPYFSGYGGDTLGQVYVLKNSGLTGSDRNPAGPWSTVATMVPPNLGKLPITIPNNSFFPYIAFGAAVGITSGGSKIIISSANFSYPDVLDDFNAQLYQGGSVWVLQKGTGDSWTVISDRRLFPQGPNGQQMGYAIAYTQDTNIVVMGGPQTPGTIPGTGNINNYGQAQVFEFGPVSTKSLWSFTNTAMLEDSLLSAGGLYYGEGSLALSRDGNTLAATYAYTDSPIIDIYTRPFGTTTWTIEDRVTTTLTTGVDRIKLSENGNVLVASNNTDKEFVTLIRTAGVWAEEDLFVPVGTTPYTFEFHLSGNGTTLFILIDNNGTPDFERQIHVYVWNAGTTSWDLQDSTTIATSNANVDWAQDWGFGMSSSYSGDTFALSFLQTVNYADPSNYQSPSAYIWRRSGTTWSATPEVATTFWYSQSTNSYQNKEGRIRMSADGERFALSNGQANRTWVMVHDRDAPGNWNVDAVLTYEKPDDVPNEGNSDQGYYWATEMSDNGDIVVVGQYNALQSRGVMFRKVDGQWRTEHVFYNPVDPALGSYFFYTVGLDAVGKAIIGEDNYSVNDNGVVWVFQKNLDAAEMQPFPFATYALAELDLVDLGGGDWGGHYYNDPTLDAVQYNVKVTGDSWEDTVYDVYFGTGLMCQSSNQQTANARVSGMVLYTTNYVDDWGTAFLVDAAHADIYKTATVYTYPTGGSATPSPIPQGTYSYPGVASGSVWYTWADYNEAPCYGNPISFEAWFSDNPSKTNATVKFSKYTHFGDSGAVAPILYNTVSGHMRRYVCGVIRKDANLATCSTGDIMCGIIYNGTTSGGEGHLVVNGIVRGSIAATAAVGAIQGFFDMYMYDLVSTFGPYSQTFDWLELSLYDNTYTLIGYAGFNGGASGPPENVVPADVYDVKWGWYHHFIPDAGVGTYAGQVFASCQTMYTHPGWPI